MPNPILIDTGYVIALINERDQFHSQAVELANRFSGQPLFTTDAVLLEIGKALARYFELEATAIIEQFLTADEGTIVHLTPERFTKVFMAQGFSAQMKYKPVKAGSSGTGKAI